MLDLRFLISTVSESILDRRRLPRGEIDRTEAKVNQQSQITNQKCAYRRPLIMRSTDACPPPMISNARAIPSIATASSLPAGGKNAGHRTAIAVTITHTIRNAPTLVKNPSSTRMPPISSASAAAPSHSHAGRMNGNGAIWENDVHLAQPGPLNFPRTFCAPCPIKAIPRASRKGTVAHVDEVEVSLRSMTATFRFKSVRIASNYKSVSPFQPRDKTCPALR